MATIQAARQQVQDDITSKAAINSISPANVGGGDNVVLDVVLERGLYYSTTTGGLASLGGTEARLAIVPNYGIFLWSASGPASDGLNIFDGPSGSKWTRIFVPNEVAGTVAVDDLSDVQLTLPVQVGDTLKYLGGGIWSNMPINYVAGSFLKDSFSLTSDGERIVLADSTVMTFMLKNSVALTGFKVGITDGGDEIVSEQDITDTGEWQSFGINFKKTTNITFYIKGIAGTVDFEMIIV